MHRFSTTLSGAYPTTGTTSTGEAQKMREEKKQPSYAPYATRLPAQDKIGGHLLHLVYKYCQPWSKAFDPSVSPASLKQMGLPSPIKEQDHFDRQAKGSQSRIASAVDERVQLIFHYCLRILKSRVSYGPEEDEAQISQQIKRRLLMDRANDHDAAAFADLERRLKQKAVLRRRTAVLKFLLALEKITTRPATAAAGAPTSIFESLFADTFTLQDMLRTTPNVKNATQQKTGNLSPTERPKSPHRALPSAEKSGTVTPMEEDDSDRTFLRNLLFALQGVNAESASFSKHGTCHINPNLKMSRPHKQILKSACEIGCLFLGIKDFSARLQENASMGLVGQSFVFAMQNGTAEYLRFLSQLESRMHITEGEKALTLKKLLVYIREWEARLRVFEMLRHSCEGLRGGKLLSAIHTYLAHGDPFVHDTVQTLLFSVSKPFFVCLENWIYEGELEDPFAEFFINQQSKQDQERNTSHFERQLKLNADVNIWRGKWRIRTEMLPKFINSTLARQIFLIGKSLNFLCFACDEQNWVFAHAKKSQHRHALTYKDMPALAKTIDETYAKISKKLLVTLKEKYHLIEHIAALKKYLLLCQGDFAQLLLEQISPLLDRNAEHLYRHELTSALDSAIKGSNGKFEIDSIREALDVQILQRSNADVGWNVFTLTYRPKAPISTVIHVESLKIYLRVSTFMLRVRRMEFMLHDCFKQLDTHQATSLWRSIKDKAVADRARSACFLAFHKARLCLQQMVHFIKQFQYYILFEVLGCSWHEFEEALPRVSDLDGLIEAHDTYLNSIQLKIMTTRIGASEQSPTLYSAISGLLSLIQRYCQDQNQLALVIQQSLSTRTAEQVKQDGWARSDETDRQDDQFIRQLTRALTQNEIETQTNEIKYQTQMKELVTNLHGHDEDYLRSLAVRLDFSEQN